MRVCSFLGIVTALLGISTLACSAGTEGDDHASTPSEEGSADDELRSRSVTEADDGKTVSVVEGQGFAIRLPSNPTAGFEWAVKSTTKTLGGPASTRFYPPPADAPIGAGGFERFAWKTKSSGPSLVGDHRVTLEYRRPWETNTPPEKTFSVVIRIVSGSCPEIEPPAPDLCAQGRAVPKSDGNGCTVGFECAQDWSCPQIEPPPPGFCETGRLTAETNASGCTVGFACK